MSAIEQYQQQRENFLKEIIAAFQKDERIVAAWLAGSYGRGDQDVLSDLDLFVIIRDEWAKTICHKPQQITGTSIPERLAFFGQFGEIAILHENHNNAPSGGSFSTIVYAHNKIVVDWILVPFSGANRPTDCLLLFEKEPIPTQDFPPSQPPAEELESIAVEKNAFFWMMSMVIAKYIARGDGIFANQWLETLRHLVREVKLLSAGEFPSHVTGGSLGELLPTKQTQVRALLTLGQEMKKLRPNLLPMAYETLESYIVMIEDV